MNLRSITTSIAIALLILGLATPVWAIPNLQIYIPGAEYVVGTDDEGNTTETWVIYSYDYELWVIGANLPIYDVKLALAVPYTPVDENGSITVRWEKGMLVDNSAVIKGPGYIDILNETTYYTGDPYIYFTNDPSIPKMGDGAYLPTHGVFPTSYYEYFIGDFCIGMNKKNKTDYERVYNYVPDPSEVPFLDPNGYIAYGWGYGEVKKFKISVSPPDDMWGYTWVDIVAYDHYIQANEKTHCIFSPFSHDGASTIPEPATMLLVGTGLIGLGWTARRKFKK